MLLLMKHLKSRLIFANGFSKKTGFSKTNAKYYWSRSNHPWGRFAQVIQNPETSVEEEIKRGSETDILVVFKKENGERFALHIENKRTTGKFTPYQPESYVVRAEDWKNTEKFKNYSEYETVLIAPLEFYRNNFEASNIFDRFVSHEEISLLLPIFNPTM